MLLTTWSLEDKHMIHILTLIKLLNNSLFPSRKLKVKLEHSRNYKKLQITKWELKMKINNLKLFKTMQFQETNQWADYIMMINNRLDVSIWTVWAFHLKGLMLQQLNQLTLTHRTIFYSKNNSISIMCFSQIIDRSLRNL